MNRHQGDSTQGIVQSSRHAFFREISIALADDPFVASRTSRHMARLTILLALGLFLIKLVFDVRTAAY